VRYRPFWADRRRAGSKDSTAEAQMKLSFGIHLAPGLFPRHGELGKIADLVKMAEDYGAEAIGTYDSAFIGDDAYIRTALLSMRKSSLESDPRVALSSVSWRA